MILATHQPIFLPWPGFFYKAMKSDCMVLLDDVQFPRGGSWLNRNRLKNEKGELWLTVPIWKKGRSLQIIRQVEIFNEKDWRKKHLRSIQQNYVNAPYFDEYFAIIESIYSKNHRFLAEFNVDLIKIFWKVLALDTQLLIQSQLGVNGKGTDLLIKICKRMGAGRFAIFPIVEKYLDTTEMKKNEIEIEHINFHPPVYPQLWGGCIYNLSSLDMLLNCGLKSKDIISGA